MGHDDTDMEMVMFIHYKWKPCFISAFGSQSSTNKLKMIIPSDLVASFLRSYLSGISALAYKDIHTAPSVVTKS